MSIASQVLRLEELVVKLKPNDRKFASSLVGQWRTKRRLTQEQQLWVDRMIDRALNPEPTVENVKEPSPVGADFSKIHALFDRARKNHIQTPRLHMQLTNGKSMKVSAAPNTGRNPGGIYVTVDDKYYGKIERTGRLYRHQLAEPNTEAETRILEAADDPSKAGRVHGHKLRWCMFCGIALTSPDSLYYGYGPICAGKWGLEWGEAEERVMDERLEDARGLFDDMIDGAASLFKKGV